MHINILTQLTIKKDIIYIKLRDGPPPNRIHDKKSSNSSHISNESKSLIIIMTLLMLKTTRNKTSLITLKRTVRAHLIDPLISDWTNMWGARYKIPHVSLVKSSNLLNHRVLSFWMKNNIIIRSWLKKSSNCGSRRRVIVSRVMKAVTTSNKLPRRRITRRGELIGRKRYHILNGRRRWCIRRELF
jgi:hypothetical protein